MGRDSIKGLHGFSSSDINRQVIIRAIFVTVPLPETAKTLRELPKRGGEIRGKGLIFAVSNNRQSVIFLNLVKTNYLKHMKKLLGLMAFFLSFVLCPMTAKVTLPAIFSDNLSLIHISEPTRH